MKFLLTLLLALALSFAQEHTITRLSLPSALRPVEPSIAINPANPDNIVAAFIRFGEAHENRVVSTRYHSMDGGKTWRYEEEKNPDKRPQGDDVMTFNAEGIAYHAYISFRGLKTKKSKRNGIYVNHSLKNTDEWAEPVVVVDHINSLRPYEDKPWLITDNSPNSKHKGNVYIAWTRFDGYDSKDPNDSTQIYFSASTDKGRSYGEPFRISDLGGDCLDGDKTVEGAVPAVAPDGSVHVVWAGEKGLFYDRSFDGGKTFGKDKLISDMPGGWLNDVEELSRSFGLPVTKIDNSNGKNRGTIYVNWIDERNGDTDVFLIWSRDGGETWTKPKRINNDKIRNGKSQFFTWLAVDPIDGSVNICYFDRRNYSDSTTDLYLARSIDGGETFNNIHVKNQKPFKTKKATFFGDYTNVDVYGGRVVIVYPHFIAEAETAVSVARFEFKLNSQETK